MAASLSKSVQLTMAPSGEENDNDDDAFNVHASRRPLRAPRPERNPVFDDHAAEAEGRASPDNFGSPRTPPPPTTATVLLLRVLRKLSDSQLHEQVVMAARVGHRTSAALVDALRRETHRRLAAASPPPPPPRRGGGGGEPPRVAAAGSLPAGSNAIYVHTQHASVARAAALSKMTDAQLHAR